MDRAPPPWSANSSAALVWWSTASPDPAPSGGLGWTSITTTDDTLLHLGYEALTPLELDLPFALKIFTLIQSNEFLALLNLANTPENFAKVVSTAIVVGDFLIRNPHIHYGDWPDFNGVTAVDRAVQIVATGSTGGP
jgi:hypothetical protein